MQDIAIEKTYEINIRMWLADIDGTRDTVAKIIEIDNQAAIEELPINEVTPPESETTPPESDKQPSPFLDDGDDDLPF